MGLGPDFTGGNGGNRGILAGVFSVLSVSSCSTVLDFLRSQGKIGGAEAHHPRSGLPRFDGVRFTQGAAGRDGRGRRRGGRLGRGGVEERVQACGPFFSRLDLVGYTLIWLDLVGFGRAL